MELKWLQGLLVGLISGFTEILPVSAQAHRLVLMTLFGETSESALLRLMLHISTLAALYYSCRKHILRMSRAQKLARIPKRRRKRPLDTRSLMDLSLLKTTLIPIILAFLLYSKTSGLGSNLMVVALFLFLNGVILYIPQFLPGSNKMSGNLTRIEGLLLGLGGAVSTLPGISCVGASVSIGTVCGMDRSYVLNMALLMKIPVSLCLIVYDMIGIVSGGLNGMSVGLLVSCLLAAAACFAGVTLGIRLLRKIADSVGYSVFAFYSWGAALFTFIFYLTAA